MQDGWLFTDYLHDKTKTFVHAFSGSCPTSAQDTDRNTLALGLQIMRSMSFTSCLKQASCADQLFFTLRRLTPEQRHSTEHSLDLFSGQLSCLKIM